jgi:D-alanyl-D-alanine carboxypeptidase
MSKIKLLAALGGWLLALQVAAQSIPQELDAMFDATVRAQRNSLVVKSLSAAVQFSDGQVWAGTFGTSTTFPVDSVTPEYAYAIGSITKTITAACILQLVDEGVLGLDDSVGQWLPPFEHVDPNITIRQLLRHQTGLNDVITNPAFDAASKVDLDSVWTLTNLVNDYLLAPLAAPGGGFSYSNTNYALLGLIIEAATGQTYRQAFEERFFGPLGLESLVIPPFDADPQDIAHLWIYNPSGGAYSDAHTFFVNWDSFRSAAGPIGGYYGTASDVAIWNRAFLRGDLHSAATLTQAKQTIAAGTPANGRHGLGIMERKFLGLTAYGHGGDIGYSGVTYYFPEKDMSITVLNNDSKRNSWALAPVVQALLQDCLTYEASVPTNNTLTTNGLRVQAFPNPITDRLVLHLDLPLTTEQVQVTLHDATGRRVAEQNFQNLATGQHTLALEGLANLPSGVYAAQVSLDGMATRSVRVVK